MDRVRDSPAREARAVERRPMNPTVRNVVIGITVLLLFGILISAGTMYSWSGRMPGGFGMMSFAMPMSMIWMSLSGLVLFGLGILIGWVMFAKK